MQIRRMDIEMDIDFAICKVVSEKNRRLVVPDLYLSIMSIIVNALNSISDEELPERIYAEFKNLTEGHAAWDLIGQYTIELASRIRAHFINEGHGREYKYKFVASPVKANLARDQIVVDLELTLHGVQINEEEDDILEVVDQAPDLDMLNRFYDVQEREFESFRKYKTRS